MDRGARKPRKDTTLEMSPLAENRRVGKLEILVTGAAGFVGRHLCRQLCDEGHRVHATSPRPHATLKSGPEWHRVDMDDLGATRRLFAAIEPDVVYHLASDAGARPDLALVLSTFQSLLASTINVLVAAMEAECPRIVLTGSLTEPPPSDEFAVPRSPYAAAAWAGAGYGRMYHDLFRAPVVILRPFMTFGPGQALTKLVPTAILDLLRGERPKMSGAANAADWVYISDVVEGFASAATAPGIEGQTIDLGTGTLVPNRSVVERIAGILGGEIEPELGALLDRPSEHAISANVSDARRYLRWQARTSLDEGLRQTVDWYRSGAAGQRLRGLPQLTEAGQPC